MSKRISYFEVWLLIISFFSTFYVLINTESQEYKNLYFLPLFYFVFNLVYFHLVNKIKQNGYKPGIAYKSTITIIFVRFVITPVVVVYTKYYSGIGIDPSKTSLDVSILLMVLELLFVTITLYFSIRHYSSLMRKVRGINSFTAQFIKFNPPALVFFFCALIAIIIFDRTLLLPSNFFFLDRQDLNSATNSNISSGFAALADILKHLFLLTSISFIYFRYLKHKNTAYIILAFFVSIIYMGLMTSTKRWDMLFAGILCLYLLNNLFDKIPKTIIFSLISLMIVSILSITMYKFSWYIKNSTDPLRDSVYLMTEGFQAYFSGPRNVAQAIDMKENLHMHISIMTFLNDFLGSVPVLSSLVNQTNRINVIFCQYIGLRNNTSQIIPMLGIGYSYFPLFPFIFTIICEWFVIKLDFLIQKTNKIEYKFLYLYMSFYFIMSMGFNTQIIFAFFITTYLPLYLLFQINRKITF